MINKHINTDIEYHLSSRNIKALFTGKTEHLRHFDPHIVELENDQGLKAFVGLETIELPEPEILDNSLHKTMDNRMSDRSYADHKITLKELSTLLYYSAGYKRNRDTWRKHVPSSGGFNSTEVFIIVLNSDEISPGLYYFYARSFSLKVVKRGDFRDWIRNDAFYQSEWADASAIFVLAGDYKRLYQKYMHRSIRLLLLDAGHVAQNLYIVCAAMDMKICEVLGYVENEVEDAFGLNGDTPTLSSLVIGR